MSPRLGSKEEQETSSEDGVYKEKIRRWGKEERRNEQKKKKKRMNDVRLVGQSILQSSALWCIDSCFENEVLRKNIVLGLCL